MDEVAFSWARNHLAEVVDRAARESEPVFISRHGKRVAAVIDAEALARLEELAEDALDLRAIEEANLDLQGGAKTIPWEQIKADLGLDELPR